MNDPGSSRPPAVDGTAGVLPGPARRIAARIDANPALFLALAAMGLIVFLTLRNTGLYPVIFMDEWGYSMSARHLPPSQAIFPSYVYSALYRTTNRCGSAFLDCVRFYNAVFLAASLPFLYWVAKQYMQRWAAVIVAILGVFGPVSSYSLYFMPEPVYFFFFWVLTWIVLRPPPPSPLWHGADAGLVLGLMAHVKFHAVFLAAGLIAYSILGAMFRGDRKAWRTSGVFVVAVAVAFPLTWFALQAWLVRGAPAGPAVEHYSRIAAIALNWQHALAYVPFAAKNFAWHVMALAILFSVPLAVLLHHWRESAAEGQHPGSTRDLHLYAAALLGLFTAMVAIFSASVLGDGPYETIYRLHMRYYSFVFPLLLVVAGAEAAETPGRAATPSRWQWAPAAVVGALALLGWIVLPQVYEPGIADSPELTGIFSPRLVFHAAAGLSLFSIAVWYLRRTWGAASYLFCFFPILILAADYRLATIAEHTYRHPTVHDTAGLFTRQYLGRESGKAIVVSSNTAELYRALFHLDHGRAQMVLIPPGSPVQLSQIPADRTWALVVGEHPLEFKTKQVIQRPGFVLAEVDRGSP